MAYCVCVLVCCQGYYMAWLIAGVITLSFLQLCLSAHPTVRPLCQVLQIGIQIARALSYLHPTILHRVTQRGSGRRLF
jgi:hypothetical protein